MRSLPGVGGDVTWCGPTEPTRDVLGVGVYEVLKGEVETMTGRGGGVTVVVLPTPNATKTRDVNLTVAVYRP